MSDRSTNYNELLNNIQNLQATEKQLYSELETLPPNANFERQRAIVGQISQVSAEKINLFKQLFAINSLLQQDVSRGNDDLAARTQLAKMVENQLSASKAKVEKERNLNINNLRQAEINYYFSDRYRAFGSVFSSIILVCVALVVISVLRRRYILSTRFANLLAAVVILVGCYFVLPGLWDIDSRNNMVFAEYDFAFDPHSTKNPKHSDKDDLGFSGAWLDQAKEYKKDILLLAEGECLGPECCKAPGLKYDAKHEVCVLDKGKKHSESFGNISGQSGPGGAPLDDPKTYASNLVHTDPSGEFYSIN